MSIALITVIVIGNFYIGASIASSSNPKFFIEKVSGNDEEVKNLTVVGDFNVEDGFYDNVHFNDTETVYRSELSFIESLKGVNLPSEIKQLQSDFRGFMRGKAEDPALFYEDEDQLAYATIDWDYHQLDLKPSNFSFVLEVLDKNSRDVIAINEIVPNQNNYDHAMVEDVQIIEGKVKAFVRIYPLPNESNERDAEVHVFTFDINSQKLIGDDIVTTTDRQDSGTSNIREDLNSISNSETIKPQKELLIQKIRVKEVPGEDGLRSEEIGHSFTLYNYETNEQKELSNDREAFNFKTASIYGSTIYFMNMSKNGLEIHPYGIESEEFSTKQTIQINIPEESGSPLIKLKNNKMYITSPYKDLKTKATLLVVDLKTWKTLYEGTIETRNLNESQKDYTLNTYALEVE
jgi:hypothetical protein